MAEDQIKYDVLTQEALRGVVRAVLDKIAKSGLPGEHHLYVSFETHGPGVSVSDRLKEQYPDEMTIVLQHQFWDLEVYQERFEVKLSFNNIPERLVVPYTAVKAFFDPSVQFGLQFGSHGAANDTEKSEGQLPAVMDEADDAAGVPAVADGTGGTSDGSGSLETSGKSKRTRAGRAVADVVELDAFRKK